MRSITFGDASFSQFQSGVQLQRERRRMAPENLQITRLGVKKPVYEDFSGNVVSVEPDFFSNSWDSIGYKRVNGFALSFWGKVMQPGIQLRDAEAFRNEEGQLILEEYDLLKDGQRKPACVEQLTKGDVLRNKRSGRQYQIAQSLERIDGSVMREIEYHDGVRQRTYVPRYSKRWDTELIPPQGAAPTREELEAIEEDNKWDARQEGRVAQAITGVRLKREGEDIGNACHVIPLEESAYEAIFVQQGDELVTKGFTVIG